MQVVINVPDQYFLDIPVGEIEGRLKMSTALLMFQAGQLSIGAACEFAGVDRYAFLAACKRYNIAVIDYNEDELEADFDELKRTQCVKPYLDRLYASDIRISERLIRKTLQLANETE